jgi:hypothetical protein
MKFARFLIFLIACGEKSTQNISTVIKIYENMLSIFIPWSIVEQILMLIENSVFTTLIRYASMSIKAFLQLKIVWIRRNTSGTFPILKMRQHSAQQCTDQVPVEASKKYSGVSNGGSIDILYYHRILYGVPGTRY